ncbi:D-arabinono-1,4-lactone oxidase [Micrococcaceae bacterium Sec5.7]
MRPDHGAGFYNVLRPRRRAGVWRNWAGDQACTPTAVRAPASIEEVAEHVHRASELGTTIKAVGSGHSFTGIALTDGIQLDMANLRGLLSVDSNLGRATFLAGTPLDAIPDLLAPFGLAMENLGDIDRQTLAGAVSTGTHGTGLGFGGISTQLTGLTLVNGLGDILNCSATENAELFRAAQLGLGALGIIVTLTLQCVPAFRLHAVERREGLADVLDGFADRVREEDHFEFYWFPHTAAALTKTNTRRGLASPDHRSGKGARPLSPARRFVDDQLMSNVVFDGLNRVLAHGPALIPAANRIVSGMTGQREFTDLSHRVFATVRTVRFREMEFAVPLEAVPSVLLELDAMIERRRLNISFPVEVRCAAADNIPLSTAFGRETGYIAIHSHVAAPFLEYFREAQEIFRSHIGRPHWGKWHFMDYSMFSEVYPELEKFCSLRDVVDPTLVFQNTYLDQILRPHPLGTGTRAE